jgi:CubicO group peptidase (beta-lactamase class C family)
LAGKFRYEKTFGYRSLKNPAKPDPMPLEATMWLASCTKLIGTVAAMQCVERGQLELDEDISIVLPELKELEILTGFEEGPDGKDKPILVKNTKSITLR